MRLKRGAMVPLVALLLWFSACQGGQPKAHTPTGGGPTTSASNSVDTARCQRLAKRGFTPCPPSADRLPLPPTTIRNATNSAISDTTAQEWGRAFQLAQAYYYWAIKNGSRSALTSGLLADPGPDAVGILFGDDLRDLDAAAQVNGVIIYEPPKTPITQVVAVPTNLQEAMRRQNLTPKPYGLAVRFTGPSRRTIRASDGKETPIVARDASFTVDALSWGELKVDPDLGAIWYEYGDYGCDGTVRNVCQL